MDPPVNSTMHAKSGSWLDYFIALRLSVQHLLTQPVITPFTTNAVIYRIRTKPLVHLTEGILRMEGHTAESMDRALRPAQSQNRFERWWPV